MSRRAAARQKEMSHYALGKSVTGKPSLFTTFYYPGGCGHRRLPGGVRNFSTPALRASAARTMGIESDHRTLARVRGGDVAPSDGGPITRITGVQGTAESADPPNNNGYERTLKWTKISQAVAALTPFADPAAARKVGFDAGKPYQFRPFTPRLAQPLGAFHSFAG